MKKMMFWSGCAALLLGLICGCADIGDKPPGTNSPPASLSYSADVQPILDTYCALSFCHGGAFPPNGLKLTAYDSVMTTGLHAPVVIASKPDTSYLVWKLRGTAPAGTQMPPPGNTSPTASDTTKIIQWIAEGAWDN